MDEDDELTLNEYQSEAGRHNELGQDDQNSLNAALFGLASETGSLLDMQKKILTEDPGEEVSSSGVLQELGDLLWYVARVADANGFKLAKVARCNLDRVRDMRQRDHDLTELRDRTPFDQGDEPTEQFPRRMTFRFVEGERGSVKIFLRAAEPNAFSATGPIPDPKNPGEFPARWQGFDIGEELGAELTDNSRNRDGYRYHDAIHMSFMAILNWSATMRSLLHVKRKSSVADEEQDSARPIFLEEGLVAILAAQAPKRLDFGTASSVDGDAIAAAKAITEDLEVSATEGWVWRHAISQGFVIKRKLIENKGGDVLVDLDARTIEYQSFRD
jgi:hypothetical protein